MKTALKWIWDGFKSNTLMKIIAVLFAVILWSYVISIINPERVRVVSDVPVTLDISHLSNKDLEISNSLSELLDSVNVKVKVKQSEVKSLSVNNVSAYVDLSRINDVGDYTLDVQATLNLDGKVLEVSPNKIKVHVEYHMSKQVPVIVKTTGSVPNGYYASEPEILTTTVDVKGARNDVQKVASAVCNVDLTGLTEGFSRNMDVELLDADGNVIDKSLFTEDLPSVIVKLNVLPMKTVPVDAENSIVGQDEVAPGCEVSEISCKPQKVAIAGSADVLAGISKIGLTPYSVSGKSASEAVVLEYAPPEGVTVLTNQKAEVYITIREVMKTKTYKDVALKTKDLAAGLHADLSNPMVDVTVMAGVSEVSRLSRSDIVPYVDLDGYTPGTYSVEVMFEIPKGFSEENFTASAGTVTVTIY